MPARVTLFAAMTFDGKLCSPEGSPAWEKHWPAACARCDALLEDAPETDLPDLLRSLRLQRGTILCAGSPALFRALLDEGLADALHLIVRPQISGAARQPTLTGPQLGDFLPRSISWRLRKMETVGEECVLQYSRTPETLD
jgi:riboflavin biosynthesis pyrimidine reductase